MKTKKTYNEKTRKKNLVVWIDKEDQQIPGKSDKNEEGKEYIKWIKVMKKER
jgi:hypothetical protein